MINEAYAWERQEGKPLPTLADVQAKYNAKSNKAKLNEFEIHTISLEMVEKRKNQGMSMQQIIDEFNKEHGDEWINNVEEHYTYLEKETPEQKEKRYAGYDQKTLDYIGSSK